MTANLSMVALQGCLARQSTAPTPEQREAIHDHPRRSATMLRESGIADELWLAAVEQHHERIDGSGYPSGRTDIAELAQAVQYVDVFTAKLSARASRAPMPPNRAAREIFTQSGGHPLAAALVKEFGIYPPGCFVRLASGEIAIVLHRGATVNTPTVACLTKPGGQPLMRPQRRETTRADSAIVAPVSDSDVMVRVPWETLYEEA